MPVETEIEKGTIFKIYLPAIPETPNIRRIQKKKQEELRGTETILIVEDQGAILQGLRELLQKYGYTVLEAPAGEATIQIAHAYKKPIHLVVTDLMMPRIDGLDLANRIHPLHPETKVLFISGSSGELIIKPDLLQPGIVILQKPFAVEVLLEKIREMLVP